MITKKMTSAALFTFSAIGQAYAVDVPLSLQECNVNAWALNKSLPMRLDKLMTLENTFCTPGRIRPVFNYRGSLDASKAELGDLAAGLAKMKKQQTNLWCTNPEQFALLKRLDVVNLYYDRDQVFLGEFSITYLDCNQ